MMSDLSNLDVWESFLDFEKHLTCHYCDVTSRFCCTQVAKQISYCRSKLKNYVLKLVTYFIYKSLHLRDGSNVICLCLFDSLGKLYTLFWMKSKLCKLFWNRWLCFSVCSAGNKAWGFAEIGWYWSSDCNVCFLKAKNNIEVWIKLFRFICGEFGSLKV